MIAINSHCYRPTVFKTVGTGFWPRLLKERKSKSKLTSLNSQKKRKQDKDIVKNKIRFKICMSKFYVFWWSELDLLNCGWYL